MSALDTYSGTFKVMRGTTDVTTGNGVVYAVVSETGCDASINSSTGVYTLASVTSDTASATFSAVLDGVTITKVFSVAKSRAGTGGTAGAAAKTLSIICDRQTIAYDAAGAASPSTQTTTFTAQKQNTTNTVTWSVTDAAGVAQTPTATYLSAATGDSVTMTEAQFASARNGTSGVIVTGTLTDGSTLTDKISIVRVQAGATGATGSTGSAGLNNATVNLYQRAASTPSVPGSTTTYTFATGVLSGTLGSWSQVVPGGSNPVYITTATASSNTSTDTIATGEWSSPVVFAQDGATGLTGATGPTLSISPDKGGFTYAAGALSPSSQTITYTALAGGSSVSANWTLKDSAGSTLKSATGSTTFTVSNTDIGSNAAGIVSATYSGVSVHLVVTVIADKTSTPNPVVYSGTAPSSPVDGTLWTDISLSPAVLKKRVSGAWQSAANYVTQGTHIGVANNADVALKLVALGPTSITIVGNTVRNNGLDGWGASVVGTALPNTAYASMTMLPGVYSTALALDDENTSYADSSQAAYCSYRQSDGAFTYTSNGSATGWTLHNAPAGGLTGTVEMRYDGVKYEVWIAGVLRASKSATAGLTHYPKFYAYDASQTYTGLTAGYYTVNAFDASAMGPLAPANNATVGAIAGTNLKESNGTVVSDIRFLNDQIAINASTGAISNIGTGAGSIVDNTKITVDGSGVLMGIGTASKVVENAKITIDGTTGVMSGIGTGSKVVDNARQAWADVSGAGRPSDYAGTTLQIALQGSGTSTITGNSATRTDAGGSWNQAHISKEFHYGTAFVSGIFDTHDTVFGLTDSATLVATTNTIAEPDYAFHRSSNGNYYCYESGVQALNMGTALNGVTFGATTTFLITYDGVNVRYYANGVLMRTVATTAGRTFWAMTSNYSTSSKVSQVQFGPYTTNAYNASIMGSLAPANNATVGATWGTDVASRPTELTDGRISTALNSSGKLRSFSNFFISTVVGVRNTNDVALTSDNFSGAARISIPSHERKVSGESSVTTITYNSGTITGLSFSTVYYVYVDDPNGTGGAVTYSASTNSDNTVAGATTGRVLVGYITTAASGGGGTSGGGGGIGGGGGGGGVIP